VTVGGRDGGGGPAADTAEDADADASEDADAGLLEQARALLAAREREDEHLLQARAGGAGGAPAQLRSLLGPWVSKRARYV
jgi:hypothetical protein